ncbi:MAG: hydrogenobyrinic acid a,c-diamide synthase (glutamine-hydrolyzing) [Desulfomonile tiedjei]|nr:hydrogenobyrinic acid a,c-diamide synthase (glutamine-hydrolyzing) [Desulfomonile tiedjei]
MTERSAIPRIVLAALKGGAGKTFLAVGIVAALRRRGLSLSVFKKGPDYIDAGWLGLAGSEETRNLDAYLFDREVVLKSFVRGSVGKDVAVVEGNRGLFDGVDAAGSYSTAELAKLLKAPVILIIDATKTTRTAAALVLGCRLLDPDLDIRGVILNRVAGARHESVLRESIEQVCSIPVIGSVKKLSLASFPQRHLGLLPLHEHPRATEFLEEAAETAEQSLDLDRILAIADSAPSLEWDALPDKVDLPRTVSLTGVRIGVMRDSAFQFYYPENLEALSSRGAQLVEISGLAPGKLPRLDALYIGGGFPETHAERLAENLSFKKSLLSAIEGGLPVYAECGGLMYLSRSLRIDENVYPMVGLFPVDTVLERKPQGHGYLQVEVTGRNPFYPEGAVLTGHEFHYSYITGLDAAGSSYAFRVLRGHGMDGSRDGICIHNALGTYLHIHALGESLWAEGLLRMALRYRTQRDARDADRVRCDGDAGAKTARNAKS